MTLDPAPRDERGGRPANPTLGLGAPDRCSATPLRTAALRACSQSFTPDSSTPPPDAPKVDSGVPGRLKSATKLSTAAIRGNSPRRTKAGAPESPPAAEVSKALPSVGPPNASLVASGPSKS
jgi:hypothetical protein